MINKKLLKNTLLILLVITFCISPLSACSKKEPVGTSSVSSQTDNVSSEESDVDDPSQDTPLDDSTIDFSDDFGDMDDTFADMQQDDLTDAFATQILVNNGSEPITNTFRGLSGTVHFPYTYWQHNTGIGIYSQELADYEFDRMRDTGFKYVRAIFKDTFAWDKKTKSFNWDTEEMQWIYKWAKSLQERDIEIVLNVPYTFISYAVGVQNWNKETDYMLGTDVYSKGPENAHARTDLVAERIGLFISDALKAFKGHGINNVTHILFFTEPYEFESQTYDSDGSPLLPKDLSLTDIYLKFLKQTNKELQKQGLRNTVKIIGPNSQENVAPDFLLMNAVLDEMDKTGVRLVDIISSHCYPSGESIISDEFLGEMDSYMLFCNEFIERYKKICKKYNWKDPEFWLDETNASLTNHKDGDITEGDMASPWIATQFAASYIHAMNLGVSNAIVWNFTNQYWPNNTEPWYSQPITPSILTQQEPYSKYYGYALLSQHLGNKNGKVYETIDDWSFGITSSCVQLEDGNWVLVVVNTGMESINFEVTFEKAIGQNMYRHLFTSNYEARLDHDPIPADKGFRNVKTTLKDTIPIGGIAVYTTKIMK